MGRSGWAYTDLGYFNELGGMTGSVQFRTDCNSLSGSTNFVFATSSNRVGIREDLTQSGFDIQRGSTALPLYHPNAALEVRGDMNVTGSIYAKNYYIQNVSFMDFTGSTKFGDSSGDYHAFTGSISVSEKIGIGTSTPAKHLHLYGSSGEVELRLGSSDKYSSVVQKSNAELIIQNASGGDILFYDDSAETMRIKDGGNIGIGVADPDAQLEILDTGTQLKLSYDSDSYATLAVASDSGLTIASAESGDIQLDSAADLIFDAAGGNIEFKDSGTTQLTIDMDGTPGAVIMQLKVDSDDFVFKQYDGTEVFRVEDNASLQIGTAAGLNIANSSNDMVFKLMSDAKDMIFKQYDGNEVIRIADDRRLYFYDKGGEHIASDGTNLTITSGAKVICAAAANSSLEPATDNNVDLGSSAKRWANVYTGDLHLKNDRGDWTMVEEADYLTLVNNVNGKKYKIMMEEIED